MAMRLCCECKKNHPAISYERKVRGGVETEHYCLSCYESKFLSVSSDGHENGKVYEVCPYCGRTAEELKKTALVGCAHCYHTLGLVAVPMVVRMQQNAADVHRGKHALDSARGRADNRAKELLALAVHYENVGEKERATACRAEIEGLKRSPEAGGVR